MKDLWKNILGVVGPLFRIISENSGFILGILLTGVSIFAYLQWQKNQDLTENIVIMEEEARIEAQRLLNNINSLNDSIQIIKNSNIRYKQIVSVKQGEIQYLNNELVNTKKQFEKYISTVIDTVYHIENIYISDISMELDSNDIDIKVDSIGVDSFNVSLADSNIVYSHKTNFNLVNQVDSNKSTLLIDNIERRFEFNLRMSLAQTIRGDGSIRVFLKLTDREGNQIPEDLISIPLLTGANYIDMEKQPPIKVVQEIERKNFTISIGPAFGIFNKGGVLRYDFGLGLTVGYKLWEF